MNTTVSEFASQITKEFGPSIAEAFCLQFKSHSQQITYDEGMDTLDRTLLGTATPQFPAFGPTDSLSKGGEIIFRD